MYNNASIHWRRGFEDFTEPIHGISFTAAPSHYWQTFSGFNMAVSLPTFPPFDVHSNASSTVVRWKKWLRWFENMMIGLNIKDDLKRKRALLLHYTGEEINDIFETLPDTGEENNYQAAIDAQNAHFAPTANSEFSIYCFRQAKQQPNETLDTFHTRLQQLAMPCSFTDNDKEVKIQIIQACTSHKLRHSALQHPEWLLSNLLSSGRAMELANKRAADIEQLLEALSVNRIHAKQMHEHSNNPRNVHWTRTQTGKTCYFCGDKYPHTSHCPAKSK